MGSRLVRSALLAASVAVAGTTATGVMLTAARAPTALSGLAPDALQLPALRRFLATSSATPERFVAIRHLEARNDHFNKDAWMDVRVEADAAGFRFAILAEGGSGYIRSKLFKNALQTEQKIWASGEPDRSGFTLDNYTFEDKGAEATGLAWLGVTPRRKDMLLVIGSIFVRPEDGELVRIEGALAKTPSFWTKKVLIVRRYERIGGIRLPVWMQSTAAVRIAGASTFTTTYHYETVNGLPVTHAVVASP
jgi:hypothetical protein